jgi:uncharacterized protein (TIGR02996 family)
MSMLDSLLQGIVDNPHDGGRWLVLADWLDEYDDPRRAELLRLHRRLLATCCEPDEHPERAVWQGRIVELLGQGVQPCVPQKTVTLAEGVETRFSCIPPGIFLMGSPESEERRQDKEVQHRVTLTQGFHLGIYLVTQAQWQTIMGNNPSNFKEDTLPVETVSWDDCQEFITKLSQKTGRRFRLPTEAEWEYACRAGTTTPFFFGETIGTEQANYGGNDTYGKGKKGVDRQKTTPAGTFPANAWGLHDLHGNVWEWCQDWNGPYEEQDQTDPKGSKNATARVLRGGSWCYFPWFCRSAFRFCNRPGRRLGVFGCRVLLCLD